MPVSGHTVKPRSDARSLGEMLVCCETATVAYIERLTAASGWQWRVTLLSVALSLTMSFPSIDVFLSGEFDRTWAALAAQIAHPFTPKDYPPLSHEAKMAFRLTLPTTLHILGLGTRSALLVGMLSGVALLYLTAGAVFRLTADRVTAALCTVATATTFTGASAFCDLRGVFDGLALALLVGAIYTSSPLASFVLCFLAAFTDERSLLAGALLFLLHTLRRRLGAPDPSKPALWPYPLAAVAYIGTRLALGATYGLSTPLAGVGLSTFVRQIHSLPLGVWTALEGLWIPVGGFLCLLALARRWWLLLGYGAVLAGILVGANSVIDVTRSAIYVFPVVLSAAVWIGAYESRFVLRRLCTLAAAVR
jgi:hypothetical protein